MKEELKYIVSELNRMFNSDYNLISFDSLSQNDLLQILCDVLAHLNAANDIQVNKNVELSVVSILDALKTIKYVPKEQVTATEFREGVSNAKRSIIHPILYWLLSNREQVKKRAYLAKYVQKIEMPPEIFQDEEIQNAYFQYVQYIDEFKSVYSSNQFEMKAAQETTEMSQDVIKMESDIKKLNERIEQQKKKVKIIPNREALMVNIKNYRNEIIQNKKLESQVQEHENVQKEMEQRIRNLHEKLSQKRTKPSHVSPIKQITEELQINKILMDSQLPNELNKINKKFNLCTIVKSEIEPSQEELQVLKNDVAELSMKVKTLLEKKVTVTMNRDDRLGPFRNQANKIANKKQQLSDAVMNLKTKIEDINLKINEKQSTLHSLVGGPMLHGDELKQYITKLRGLNVVYKEKKIVVQSLNNELGVLKRTLDVLKSLDPSITFESNDDGLEDDLIKNIDGHDVKYKCRSLAKEINKSLIESSQIFEKITSLKRNSQVLNDEITKTKKEFDESTGFITTQYDDLQESIRILERAIKEGEDRYEILHHEIEKNKNMLKVLNGDNGTAFKKEMNEKYDEALSKKTILEDELKIKEKNLEDNKEQVVILNEILNIFKCKEKLMHQ